MKIANSFISMGAESRSAKSLTLHTSQETDSGNVVRTNESTAVIAESSYASESLVTSNGATLSDLVLGKLPEAKSGDTLELSDEAAKAAEQFNAMRRGSRADGTAGAQRAGGVGGVELTPKQQLKLSIIQQLFESCTGHKLKCYGPLSNAEGCGKGKGVSPAESEFYKRLGMQGTEKALQSAQGGTAAPQRLVTTQSDMIYQEEQLMSFSVAGSVTTADGKTINLNIGLTMGSSFYEQHSEFAQEVQRMCDPLVLNFEGGAAELTDEKFSFDLDCDGQSEAISFVSSGSGLLALDKNGDGVINDGSELFGAMSGDGFGDLAAYDEDGNGWIDENDSIYDKLRIWTKDEKGNDSLLALGVKGVGAIYLGSVATDFTVRGGEGAVNGAIRRSGIFLTESGDAGTVQHVDFSV